MALCDTVLATRDDILSLYQRKRTSGVEWLEQEGLLPLTVGSFTSPVGESFLHFALWIWLSGEVNRFYMPFIAETKNSAEALAKEKFAGVMRFTFKPNDPERSEDGDAPGLLCTESHASDLGHLLRVMGIKHHPLGDSAPYKIPRFLYRIAEAKWSKQERYPKYRLLDIIAGSVFADRLRRDEYQEDNAFRLYFNEHLSDYNAKRYGKQVADYLGKTMGHRLGPDPFPAASVSRPNGKGRFTCWLCLSDAQIGKLSGGKNPLLKVSVSY